MFCPFVLQSAGIPRTPVVIIYLQKLCFRPSPCSIPKRRCPYLYLGFSLEGFTAFHSSGFPEDYVTVALSRYSSHIPKGLRLFPCRQPRSLTALAYDFARHEHYGHLSTVRAWTFLYSPKDCSDYLNVIIF